ncbi:transporter substrate-binding domain-containing protein [Candidatus Kuenenia stuttgartensis]|uniref:transporter substrate-binding domain-containing protein n=1 Tax=Kuenenia stuttgartiensis TaxID=174633 RepID=UPI003B968F6A
MQNAIAKELGIKLNYFQNEWDSILMSLQRGDFDIALNGIRNYTPNDSTPYYSHVHILSLANKLLSVPLTSKSIHLKIFTVNG